MNFTLQPVETPIPEGFVIRKLALHDYDRGYLELLKQLTEVGEISREQFRERFDFMSQSSHYVIVVVEDSTLGGSMLIERKFIHSCGTVGHIEDIVVHDKKRGYGFGKMIIEQLTAIGRSQECYKVILNCSQDKTGFYSKCGFVPKSVTMAHYF